MNQEKRKEPDSEAPWLFSEGLPRVPLWCSDVTSARSRSIGEPAKTPVGDYDFLTPLK